MMGIWVGCQRLILGIDCFPLVASMKASQCSLQLIKQWSTAEQVNTTLCKWKEVCGDFRTVWIHTSSLSSTLAALTIPESVSLPLYLFTLLSQRSCWFSCFSRQFWSFQTLSQFPSAHWAVTEWLAWTGHCLKVQAENNGHKLPFIFSTKKRFIGFSFNCYSRAMKLSSQTDVNQRGISMKKIGNFCLFCQWRDSDFSVEVNRTQYSVLHKAYMVNLSSNIQ